MAPVAPPDSRERGAWFEVRKGRDSGHGRGNLRRAPPTASSWSRRSIHSGFRASLKTVSPTAAGISGYFNRINDSRTHTQIGFYGWSSDFPSDGGFLPPQFSCASYRPASPQTNQDPSEFCDPKVDRLFSQALTAQASNPSAAAALWQRAEQAILAQAPLVPTYNQQDVSFVSKRVGNFQYNPQWRVLLDQLWIK